MREDYPTKHVMTDIIGLELRENIVYILYTNDYKKYTERSNIGSFIYFSSPRGSLKAILSSIKWSALYA